MYFPSGSTYDIAKIQNVFYSLFKNLFLCVWIFCLHACLCTRSVSGTCEGQKRALESLKLVLQMVVSHHVDAGN